jgi:hypothetical protein
VFLVNHANAAAAETAQDALLRWVYENGKSPARSIGARKGSARD